MKRGRIFTFSLAALLLILLLTSIRPIMSRVLTNGAWSLLLPVFIESEKPNHQKIDAIRWLQQATTVDPENRLAWRALGFALSTEKQSAKMIAAWQQVDQMDVELVHMGQQAQRVHDYQLALQRYDQAVQVNPQLRDAWYYKGLMHERFEQWQMAADAYRAGIEASESLIIELGELYFWLARHVELRQAVRDPDKALALYEQALAMSFSDAWVQAQTHYRRSEVLQVLGREREAMDEYRWVIEHRKKSYWAHVNLARLVWELDDDVAQAKILLEQAIAIDSKREAAYMLLAELQNL